MAAGIACIRRHSNAPEKYGTTCTKGGEATGISRLHPPLLCKLPGEWLTGDHRKTSSCDNLTSSGDLASLSCFCETPAALMSLPWQIWWRSWPLHNRKSSSIPLKKDWIEIPGFLQLNRDSTRMDHQHQLSIKRCCQLDHHAVTMEFLKDDKILQELHRYGMMIKLTEALLSA